MSDLRTAAQQALETLQNVITAHGYEGGAPVRARDALHAALAEPVQEPATMPGPGLVMCPDCCAQFDPALNRVEPVQEPVAWMDIASDGTRLSVRMWSDGNHEEVPLYTATPQRLPLTDEEIAAAANSVKWSQQYHVDYARAIERAHGIGGDA